MDQQILSIISLLLIFTNTLGHNDAPQAGPRVLMISMDGFRPDYLERLRERTSSLGQPNHFDHLIDNGVHAPHGVHNVFTTQTFPNHYTLVTGLYEESHGVVANHFWDPKTNTSAYYPNTPADSKYFGGQPIWETFGRQKSRTKVACFSWVGCASEINGFSYPAVVPYHKDAECKEYVTMLDIWINTHIELMLMYFSQPDKDGHTYGPNANEIVTRLLQLNDCLGQLINRMKALHVWPHGMQLLLVSDHGMETIRKSVYVPHNPSLYTMRSIDNVLMMADPVPGKETEALTELRKLENVTVYRKSELPERWHYAKNDRVREILLVAHGGILLTDNNTHPSTMKGCHGYDTTDKKMRPIFIASGSMFKSGLALQPHDWSTTDVYLLLCTILGIVPAPNNGTMAHVNRLLVSGLNTAEHHHGFFPNMESAIMVWITSISVCVFVLIAVILSYIWDKQGKTRLAKDIAVQRINMENKTLLMYNASDVSDDEDELMTVSIDTRR